jgi:signal transduction histidine kinase
VTHNLTFRLIASFTLIIVIIFGSVFVFNYYSTRHDISRMTDSMALQQDQRMQDQLSHYYQLVNSWDGVQETIVQWGSFYGRRIIVTDASGIVSADSDGKLVGTAYTAKIPGLSLMAATADPSSLPAGTGNQPGIQILPLQMTSVGTLYVSHGELPDLNRTALQLTYNSIGANFLRGGFLAMIIAIILALLISRRILAPVKALSQAARSYGKGDFSRRVADKGRGELAALSHSFNSMADNLERTQTLRRNMVADIAHELRTPLTNLKGYLEAISDGVVEPNKATIDSLSDEASTLSHLVADLQELSLADAGELKMAFQPEDAAALIRDTIAAINPKVIVKNISVSVVLPDTLSPVNIDARRIRQVLNNLLENAIAHTPTGGKIEVTAREEGKLVFITIADNGEGIPEKDLPMIFERFYRVDKSRTRATGGSGIGLTIVKRLVEAHGGTINVASTVGQGASFTFSLPSAPNYQSPG